MFNDVVKLKWQGEEFSFAVTMALIKRLERSGINLLQTAIDIDSGGIPKVSMVSEFYAILLKEAGADVSEEDVYISIMKNPAGSAELVGACRFALRAFFPNLDGPERPQEDDKLKKK